MNPCRYNLTEKPANVIRFIPSTVDDHRNLPTEPKWSNLDRDIPAIGDRVESKSHGKIPGTVIGYFVEHGWAGVHVRLDRPWINGNGKGFDTVHVFGVDLDAA